MQPLRDPLYRNIALEPWAVDLVDSPEIQRLRRIRQLGTAYLVYPGANHTRFEHCIGAHKLAQDATRAFQLAPDIARPLQAAALLHDVGHGPMSHLFEEVDPDAQQHHEEYGADLVQWSGLGDRLRSAGIEPRRVAEHMKGNGPYSEIVSGDIDVDRMDYLVRDAHYTGLRVSVDPERILHTLTWEGGHLHVREEGLTAVEALLHARFLMYPAVYFHHTCRAGETMIVAAMRRLVADGTRLEALRGLDDAGLLATLEAAPGFPRTVARRIHERRLYKRAFEGTWGLTQSDAWVGRLAKDANLRAEVEREIAQTCRLAEGDVLIDVPRPPLVREVEARVLRKDGSRVPLKEVSTLVRNLLAAQMDHWRFWVFAPKESHEAVGQAFRRYLEPKKG